MSRLISQPNLMRSLRTTLLILMLLVNPVSALAIEQRDIPQQPSQPASGPGGRDYAYGGVKAQRVGESPTGALIFSPDDISDAAYADLPITIFIHGFMAIDPEIYRGWIDHLVRRGGIVIFPDFQTLNIAEYGPNTWPVSLFSGVRESLTYLESNGAPDIRTTQTNVIGHSLGGVLAVRYALDAEQLGFPPVSTLWIVQPGGCSTCGNFGDLGIAIPLDQRLSPTIHAQVLVGDRDTTVGDSDARSIWPLLDDIPDSQKDYVTIVSDDHGVPNVVADHNALGTGGGAPGTEDVIDWFALWRPHDAMVSCIASQIDCAFAFGDTPEHRDMGYWSDGTPIRPLVITQGPQ